ncbi:MAG: nucleotidyltransferase domain-containing protein [Oscillospiraceae bacterium]|nr:nucleotidyltransferase domain-containing protein [Oscillospiraceae bacterium]
MPQGMSDRIYSIEEIKHIVAPIAIKYDVDRVFLFGSYARGEANSTSDLDFVIDKGRLRGLKFASMLGDLQENFDKSVDLLTSSSLAENEEYSGYPSFKQKIEKDMVIIYEQ